MSVKLDYFKVEGNQRKKKIGGAEDQASALELSKASQSTAPLSSESRADHSSRVQKMREGKARAEGALKAGDTEKGNTGETLQQKILRMRKEKEAATKQK